LAAALAQKLAHYQVKTICGPLTGGAFLAQMVAEELGVAFVYADRMAPPSVWHAPSPRGAGSDLRDSSTTPSEDAERATPNLFPVAYPIPAELAEFVRSRRVAVVNDVINAGSAVRGAFASLRALEAVPVALGALLILGDAAGGLSAAEGVRLESLAHFPNRIWPPQECPLCAASVPLDASQL
jgi:orotate phosphoribosyltransferase